jgi:hypothetical protein
MQPGMGPQPPVRRNTFSGDMDMDQSWGIPKIWMVHDQKIYIYIQTLQVHLFTDVGVVGIWLDPATNPMAETLMMW